MVQAYQAGGGVVTTLRGGMRGESVRGHTCVQNTCLSIISLTAAVPTQVNQMNRPDGQQLLDPLTERELEVLRLIADGLSNHEISQELIITHETVKWYNKQIYSKLDVHSRTQAVAQARGLGLFDAQPDAPAYAAIASKHNLPIQIASFVGREREIAEVQQLLGSVRLLSLTGPGGTGKTRLSLQVVAGLLNAYKHGVWFADLASTIDLDLVPSAIASVFNLKEAPGTDIAKTLKSYLAARELLLVLDNYEHIIETAPEKPFEPISLVRNTALVRSPFREPEATRLT